MIRPFAVVALVACGEGPPLEEDPEVHACEHRTEAGARLTATLDPAEAPEIAPGESPFTVALVPLELGFVRVEIERDTAALLFLGTADVMTVLLHDGVEEPLPFPAPNEVCPEDIPEHFDLDLHPGTWNIGVGPAGVADVWLLLSPVAGHAHEE